MKMKTFSASTVMVALHLIASPAAISAEPKPKNPTEKPDIVYRFPVVTAPKLAAAPKIDGTIDKAEWSGAARSAPFVNWRNDPKGAVSNEYGGYWAGYTDDALHLAWRLDRPAFALTPKADATEFDNTAVWSDDKIEIMVRPGVGESGQGYNIVVNAKGTRADRYNNRIDWSEPMTTAARVTEKGWEGELTFPFKSMGRGTPKPGETWEIFLISNPKTPANVVVASSYIHDWPAHHEYGYLRFGGDNTPAVRVLEAGPIGAKEAGMTVELAGHRSAVPVKIEAGLYAGKEGSTGIQAEVNIEDVSGTIVPRQVDLNFFDAVEQITATKTLGVLKPVQKIEETVTVEPNKPLRFPIRGEVPYGAHVLLYRVRHAETGELIAGGAAPFVQSPLFNVKIDNYLLVARGLKISADYVRMAEVTDKCRVVVELIEGDKVVAKFDEPATPAQGRTVKIIETPKRFDATYTVRTRVLGADGKPLAEDKRTVAMPRQPVWLDNTIGITDDPLPGWSPIELKGDEAKVVLRTYKLGPSGLPATIQSREKQLLTGPVGLTLAGQSPNWTRKLESQSAGKVTWSATAAQGDAKLTLRTTLEYDGALIYDLTIAPSGKEANLKHLALRIPYRAGFARNRIARGDKQHDFKEKPLLKEFLPMIELSDFDTGLSWYCEWDKHWQIGKGGVAELKESGDTLDCVVRMIGEEGKTITEPVTITFALQALPVRELDVSYQYKQRHLYSGWPVYIARDTTEEELVDNDLRYPLAGNVTAETGSVGARIAASHAARFFLIGADTNAVGMAFARAYWEQYRMTFYLFDDAATAVWGGKKFDARKAKLYGQFYDVPWEDGFIDVGLTWRKEGEQVQITHGAFGVDGKVHSSVAALPWERWQKAFASGEIVIGGGKTVAVDQVLMSPEALPIGVLLDAVRLPAAKITGHFSVIDSCDELRFYRGRFITAPQKIAAGKGGVAGGKLWGPLVKSVEGRRDHASQLAGKPSSNRAVLLPSKQDDTIWDIAQALRIRILMPDFEQFHTMVGYYGQQYIHNPASVRSLYEPSLRRGFKTQLYVGFGIHPKFDVHVSPFAEELSQKPKGLVYTAEYPSLGLKPTRDYILWQLKKSVDEYGIRSLHLDGTINVRNPEFDPLLDRGFVDEQGKQHPRWWVFGARDLAKRMRWLMHVYCSGEEEGLILLGHGARNFPLISGFVDITMSGEGGMFYASTWEKLQPPEEYPDMMAYRVGVPHQTLTKGGLEHKFGPNYTFLYMLLVNGSLRHSAYMNQPGAWHIDPKAPSMYTVAGEYDPYFARSGVPEVSNPSTLWWMLADDMDLEHATFVPFFRVAPYLTFAPGDLRGALHFHTGRSALVIVANTTAADLQGEVTVDLKKLGLDGKNPVAFDAFTDDEYKLEGGKVKVAVPSKSYRLVRIEGK